MKMKVNYNVTANKEADMSNYACEDEEELTSCLHLLWLQVDDSFLISPSENGIR
jgi:hypothetical protein